MGFIIAILSLLYVYSANAGNRVGNGGDVMICPKKIVLLDFYEVWRFEEPKADAGQVLVRLKKVAPKLAEQYDKRLQSIKDEMQISEDIKPVENDDSLHGFEPAGDNCLVKQIALRMDKPPTGAKRFTVNKKYYAALSKVGQDGLVLHEIVYEHFNKLGQTDSRQVRKFIAHIFAEEFDGETSGKFWSFVKDLKIPLYPEH